MNFNLIYSNHDNQVVIEDYLTLVKLTLEAAGHTVSYRNVVVGDEVNVFLERFDPEIMGVLPEMIRNKVQYVIVASESLTGNTFNDFDFNGGFYDNKVRWQGRYDRFLTWAEHAKAIWICPSDMKQLDIYREKTGRPVVEMQTPFFESYHHLRRRPVLRRDIDFLLSGTPTKYREGVITRLKQSANVAQTLQVPKYIRDDHLARTRFCLDVRLCREWGQISALRVWYLLMNRCYVIAEKPELEAKLGKYILMAESDSFVETCLAANENPSCFWFERRLEAFREETNAKEEAERLVQETFG